MVLLKLLSNGDTLYSQIPFRIRRIFWNMPSAHPTASIGNRLTKIQMRQRQHFTVRLSGSRGYNIKRGINYRICNSNLLYRQCLAAAGLPCRSASGTKEVGSLEDDVFSQRYEDDYWAEKIPEKERVYDTYIIPKTEKLARSEKLAHTKRPLLGLHRTNYQKYSTEPTHTLSETTKLIPEETNQRGKEVNSFVGPFVQKVISEIYEPSLFKLASSDTLTSLATINLEYSKDDSKQRGSNDAFSSNNGETLEAAKRTPHLSTDFKRLALLKKDYSASINDHVVLENRYLKELEDREKQLERLADQNPSLPEGFFAAEKLLGKFEAKFKLEDVSPISLRKPKNTCANELELQKGKILLQNLQNEVVIDKFNIEIRGEHLKCLLPMEWLNDELLNFYMSMLQERNIEHLKMGKHVPKCWLFNTFFFEKLTNSYPGLYNYEAVKKWTLKKKVDIFDMHLILVPINISQSHWILGVVDMRPGCRKILLYDSLKGTNKKWFSAIRRYLIDEHLDKKGQPLETIDEWDYSPTFSSVSNTPLQCNSYDCGVYVCQIAECITDGRDFDFAAQDIADMRIKMTLQIAEGYVKT